MHATPNRTRDRRDTSKTPTVQHYQRHTSLISRPGLTQDFNYSGSASITGTYLICRSAPIGKSRPGKSLILGQ
jgi:hypothetical protein